MQRAGLSARRCPRDPVAPRFVGRARAGCALREGLEIDRVVFDALVALRARGKDSAGAAYFLSPLATAPVAQSSEIRAATEPPPTSASRSGKRAANSSSSPGIVRLVGIATTGKMCSALN
jgi:hypothetical protein